MWNDEIAEMVKYLDQAKKEMIQGVKEQNDRSNKARRAWKPVVVQIETSR
jgi:hypothetical protein